MVSTPGVIKRYVAGQWLREGSFILAVASVAALPAAPTDDQVWAFTKDTHELYYSENNAWVKFSGGSSGAAAGYFGSSLATSSNIHGTQLAIGTVRVSNGFTAQATAVRCDVAGTYHVTAALTFTGSTGQWVIATISQYRAGSLVIQYPHVSASAQ